MHRSSPCTHGGGAQASPEQTLPVGQGVLTVSVPAALQMNCTPALHEVTAPGVHRQKPFWHGVASGQACVATLPFSQRAAMVPLQASSVSKPSPRALQRCGVVPWQRSVEFATHAGAGGGATHPRIAALQVPPLHETNSLGELPAALQRLKPATPLLVAHAVKEPGMHVMLGLQVPPRQVPALLLQARPSLALAATQPPVLGLQVFERHSPRPGQLTSGGLEQTPFWHVSLPLQALPSEQLTLLSAWVTQPRAGSQATLVQTLPSVSLQVTAVPKRPLLHGVNWLPLHWPALQLLQMVLPGAQPSWPQAVTWRAPFVHVSRVPEGGSHVVRLATAGNWQPTLGLQLSLVQGLPSLQLGA